MLNLIDDLISDSVLLRTQQILIETLICVKNSIIIHCKAVTILKKKDIIMIDYQHEIDRFKPSLDVDQIEDAIVKMDLTDMNDIMTKLIENAIEQKKDSEK